MSTIPFFPKIQFHQKHTYRQNFLPQQKLTSWSWEGSSSLSITGRTVPNLLSKATPSASTNKPQVWAAKRFCRLCQQERKPKTVSGLLRAQGIHKTSI